MNVALIGCGPLGLAYATAARSLGLRFVACADPSLAAARNATALAGGKAQKEINSLLAKKDIDAVVLCAPLPARSAHLRLALDNGKHVFSPAPVAHDAAATKAAVDAARAASAHFYIAYDSRVAPEDLALARQLDAGAIGRPGFVRVHRAVCIPKTPASRGTKKSAAGNFVITDLLARDIDWLVRRFGAAGTAFVQTTRQAGIDHAGLTLTFPRGPIAQLIGTCSSTGLPDRATVEVCGTDGMLQYSSDDPVFEATARTSQSTRTSPVSPDLPTRHLESFLLRLQKAPSKQQYEHDSNVARTLDAILRSARSGREQRP